MLLLLNAASADNTGYYFKHNDLHKQTTDFLMGYFSVHHAHFAEFALFIKLRVELFNLGFFEISKQIQIRKSED